MNLCKKDDLSNEKVSFYITNVTKIKKFLFKFYVNSLIKV